MRSNYKLKAHKQIDIHQPPALHLVLTGLVFAFLFGSAIGQIFPNSDFEDGDDQTSCHCPTGYTCQNDTGRVVGGLHPTYDQSSIGCASGGSISYTHPLYDANSFSRYVYMYGGEDRITTPKAEFIEGEKIEICTSIMTPLIGTGGTDQNDPEVAYFTFGIDGDRVGPRIPLAEFDESNRFRWPTHCYIMNITEGLHDFSVMSGDDGNYTFWIDDFRIRRICDDIPTVDLGPDRVICDDEPIELEPDVSDGVTSYFWNNGATEPRIFYSKRRNILGASLQRL